MAEENIRSAPFPLSGWLHGNVCDGGGEGKVYLYHSFSGRGAGEFNPNGNLSNNGTQSPKLEGGGCLVFEGLVPGQRVNFSSRMISLKDGSKYYVKGIRESGKDNNTVYYNDFYVEGDRDYVVAYGILGDAVAYTINYEDTSGRSLAPSETYYGNVGDRPVVSYLYIEGYQPQAYNLIGRLSENAADNVFTFVYDRARPGTTTVITTTVPGTTTTVIVPGETTTETTGGETAGGRQPAEKLRAEEMVPEQEAMPGRQELRFRMKRFPRGLQTFRLSMTKKFRWPTAVI